MSVANENVITNEYETANHTANQYEYWMAIDEMQCSII